jgi:hypothetical protein
MFDALIWPTVAVICIIVLGIIALILFKPALTRLIDRTSKAGKDGLTFERHQEGGQPKTPLLSFDEIMKLPITASILQKEKTVEAELKKSFSHIDDKQTITLLIRAFSDAQITLEFTRISGTIFGSQISLLTRLSGTQQGVSINDAEEIFKQAQTTFDPIHKDRTFNDWLNYLLTNNLITRISDKIDITQYGTDFLKFLVDARLAYERWG